MRSVMVIRKEKIPFKKVIEFEANTYVSKRNPWLIRNISVSPRYSHPKYIHDFIWTFKSAFKLPVITIKERGHGYTPRYWRVRVYEATLIEIKEHDETFKVYRIIVIGGKKWGGVIDIIYSDKGLISNNDCIIVEPLPGKYFTSDLVDEILTLCICAISSYVSLYNHNDC